MAYEATVVQAMIASPGDVLEERNLIREMIYEWNYVHSSPSRAVLIPVGWDTHVSPDLSGRPQEIINERVLKDCDLLIGLFWTRIGTATGKAASGSVEEIERHLAAGKPAMIYFSSAPVAPPSLDHEQYSALMKFRQWCQSRGIVHPYENVSELRAKFPNHLQLILRDNPYLKAIFRYREHEDASGTHGPTNDGTGIEPREQLCEEAQQLLVEAAQSKNGYILNSRTMSGTHITTNDVRFGEPGNARLEARWAFAIDQLISEGLIQQTDAKGQVFRVTEAGYRFAEHHKR